ncbi:MAG: GGDEF domain-containing protein, partial [Spirochaetia bacterium]|nr:GGDEF domain-containing protein [Spirochaetia bacterium]
SMTDSLTGIFNRRYFMEIASKTFHACRRHRKSFSIVIADLDHFKSINDTYGHGAGDLVLKKFANYFQEELRESDVLARFGGEEFIALLPDTTEQQSLVMIERIRKGLSELKIDIEDNRAICITASFGISEFRDSDENYESIFLRADRALYQAKESGRNSVILAE